ncbi:Dipeptidyl aminopeptidase [Actinomortierella wolfii]|nr:Dipeptidyl aminopeptidase [Actinomortierella wolfii]
MSPTVAPYGEWKSPISADFITSSAIDISCFVKNEKNGYYYWIELNGANNGRYTIMSRSPEGKVEELTPAPFNPKSRVHEYGGGAMTMDEDFLIASNDVDYCLYKIDLATKEAVRITPDSNKVYRYADMEVHPSKKFLVCVREDHTNDTPQTVLNTLVVVRLDTKEPTVQVLKEGEDFYAAPRFNPVNPTEMAYFSWNHPFMTWDHTQVFYNTLEITNNSVKIANQTQLTGFDVANGESANQPQFAPDGTLYFTSDKTGFWNIHKYMAGEKVELVLSEPKSAEFQGPMWRFGQQTFVPLKSDCSKLASVYAVDGVSKLAIIDTKSKTLKDIPFDFSVILSVSTTTEGSDDVLLLPVSSYNKPLQIVSLNLRTNETTVLLKSADVDESLLKYISKPESVTFKTENDLDAYAFYYPPTNADYVAPQGTLPPLRVLSHGGPTSAFVPDLSWSINYFCSRGFAVVAVNYGGSTNYGRAFRNRLRKLWGVVDVDDCCNAAKYLVKAGRVDENKLAIVGGSAGGYTTLACLAFRKVFKAGVSHYGIGDLEILAKETHKFELVYPESLIGPYPAAKDLYIERSPLYSADNISCPCAFFQGLEDKVVPPNQAEIMVNALKQRGVPVAYVAFEGEGHGFRIPKNVQTALRGEISFLGRIFGFTPFDAIDITIDNENAIGK